MENPKESKVEKIVEEHVFYVHGRRLVFGLLIILFSVITIGVLYYNGKIIYEKGLETTPLSYASTISRT